LNPHSNGDVSRTISPFLVYVGAVAIYLLIDPKGALSFSGFPSEGIPYPASLVAGVAYSQ